MFINNQILGTKLKCRKDQINEKKIITSLIKNILKPFVIVFWTRNVILPSLDSICKSLNHETNNINIK